MATGATELRETRVTGPSIRILSKRFDRCEQLHEVREGLDVVAVIFRLRNDVARGHEVRIAARRLLAHELWAGDAHLVEVGVGRELEKRRDLRFPTELADGIGAGRYVEHHVYPAANGRWLRRSDRCERGVRRCVHQAEPEQGRRAPHCPDVCVCWHWFARLRERAIWNRRALIARQLVDAEQIEELPALQNQGIESAVVGAPGAHLELNAGAAGCADRMADGAGLFVE